MRPLPVSALAYCLLLSPQASADTEPDAPPESTSAATAPLPETPSEEESEGVLGPPPSVDTAEEGPPPMAYRTYRARSLRVEQENIRQEGETMVISSGYTGYHPPWLWPGWYGGTSTVVRQPDRVIRSWGVYQDFARLEVDDFLDEVGQPERAQAIRDEVAVLHQKRDRRRWLGLAGLGTGLASGIAGALDEQNSLYPMVGLVSLLAAGGSFFSAGIAEERATNLQHSYPNSFTPGEVRELVDAHNELLRQELRLGEREAILLESGRRNSDR